MIKFAKEYMKIAR